MGITLIHLSTAPTVTAHDRAANVVDSQTMTVARAPETLHSTGLDIPTLVVTAPQDEMLILEICAR